MHSEHRMNPSPKRNVNTFYTLNNFQFDNLIIWNLEFDTLNQYCYTYIF